MHLSQLLRFIRNPISIAVLIFIIQCAIPIIIIVQIIIYSITISIFITIMNSITIIIAINCGKKGFKPWKIALKINKLRLKLCQAQV